jgi:hypothetical protein
LCHRSPAPIKTNPDYLVRNKEEESDERVQEKNQDNMSHESSIYYSDGVQGVIINHPTPLQGAVLDILLVEKLFILHIKGDVDISCQANYRTDAGI